MDNYYVDDGDINEQQEICILFWCNVWMIIWYIDITGCCCGQKWMYCISGILYCVYCAACQYYLFLSIIIKTEYGLLLELRMNGLYLLLIMNMDYMINMIQLVMYSKQMMMWMIGWLFIFYFAMFWDGYLNEFQ